MLSQTDTEGAFGSFVSKGLTVSVLVADRDGGAGSVVDLQVDGGKQLLPFTDPSHQSHMVTFLLPNPLFSSPCRVLGQTASPAPSLEVLSARLDGVLTNLV